MGRDVQKYSRDYFQDYHQFCVFENVLADNPGVRLSVYIYIPAAIDNLPTIKYFYTSPFCHCPKQFFFTFRLTAVLSDK